MKMLGSYIAVVGNMTVDMKAGMKAGMRAGMRLPLGYGSKNIFTYKKEYKYKCLGPFFLGTRNYKKCTYLSITNNISSRCSSKSSSGGSGYESGSACSTIKASIISSTT